MNKLSVTSILLLLVGVYGLIPIQQVNYECSGQVGCSHVKGKQCCQSKVGPIGKRSVSTSLPGFCVSHGVDGQSCLVDTVLNVDGTYNVCPCGKGYACHPNGVTVVPGGAMGTCQKVCTSNSQCGHDECCRIGETFKGRRKRQTYQGVCLPFNVSGQKCVLGFDLLASANVSTECPCANPLTCVDDGVRTVPQDFGKCGVANKGR